MWCSSRTALALAVSVALAPTASADKAAADVAFAEAKRLMAAGKIAEACPKFELSNQQDPQLGTLLNVADCHEQIGKLATAWAEFRAAMELAKNRSDTREAFARERSERLAPRISEVTLVKQGVVENLHVSLDGRDVTALVSIKIPIDPGEHVITTRVGDGPEVSSKIRIDHDAQKITVRVPVEPADTGGDGDAKPVRGSRTRKLVGLGTAGAGLIVAGVGFYFGKRAFDQYDDSRAFCDDANHCDPKGAALVDDARSSALKSNVLVGVGVGAVAVGVVLWLTAPKERANATVSARPIVTPTMVGGAFGLTF